MGFEKGSIVIFLAILLRQNSSHQENNVGKGADKEEPTGGMEIKAATIETNRCPSNI